MKAQPQTPFPPNAPLATQILHEGYQVVFDDLERLVSDLQRGIEYIHGKPMDQLHPSEVKRLQKAEALENGIIGYVATVEAILEQYNAHIHSLSTKIASLEARLLTAHEHAGAIREHAKLSKWISTWQSETR